MKHLKRTLALLLALGMMLALAACKPTDPTADPSTTTPDTTAPVTSPADEVSDKVLVIGIEATFEEKWNPFLVESAYDHQVVDQIFAPIAQLNDRNELVDYAGHIETEVQDDGQVLYTVTIQPGMKFSDGTPVTIDDYIYSFYVCADPSYTGPHSLIGGDNVVSGVLEYYYDDVNYAVTIDGYKAQAAEFAANITLEQFIEYAVATNIDGWWAGDPAGDIGDGRTWSEYAIEEGYEDKLAAIDATSADAMLALIAEIEYDNYLQYYDVETWYFNVIKAGYVEGSTEDGIDVPEISGIKKIDELTCTILYTGIDIYADRGLAHANGLGNLVPKHYYGEFTKGDVSAIVSNMVPMGSGAYIWGGFSDNIATATANPNFFLGTPKIGTVRWQYIPQEDIIPSLASGAIDIANPTGSQENVAELNEQGIAYHLTENAGYGYLGFNHNNLSLNVRKGIAHLLNRKPAVEGYYGTEIAKVIERPMTTTLAEYPDDATEYYGYDPAKALEYFMADGYTQNAAGKLVNAQGEQLVVNAYVGGSGKGQHPAYAMLVQAVQDLNAMGGEFQLQDVEFGVLQGAMNDGTADMFCLAWSSVYDCDKSTQFRSTGGQNRFNYADPKMDAILDKIVQTIDLDERRVLVAEMLDMAMDAVIEFPLYQRNNILAYNDKTLDMDTIPQATSSFDYQQVLWQVDLK